MASQLMSSETEERMLQPIRLALLKYELSGLTRRDRIVLMEAAAEALRTVGGIDVPSRRDRAVRARRYRLIGEGGPLATPAGRIYAVLMGAPAWGDPEWPSLLEEIVPARPHARVPR